MKIIKPNFEIWEQEEGLEGIYKQIEKCGRVCYASDPIEGKAKDFVLRIAKLGHTAMLEHGSIHLVQNMQNMKEANREMYLQFKYAKFSPYSRFEVSEDEQTTRISTNMRVICEQSPLLWEYIMEHDCLPEGLEFDKEPLAPRVTVHFTTQIAITREFNRHRVNSMAEQSTRYCDYSGQGKKFEEVGINLPSWMDEYEVKSTLNAINSDDAQTVVLHNYCDSISRGESGIFDAIDYWLFANLACEFSYQNLRRLGWTPQQARVVLPLDTNTQLSHTAFVSDWEHFFALRDDEQHAHPDAFVLANPLHQEFRCRGYIV